MIAPRSRVRSRLALTGLAVAGLLALSGCGAGAQVDSAPVPLAPELASPAARDGVLLDPAAADRSIITTGWATVLVEAPLDAAGEAARIAERAGGRVEASSTNAPSEYSGGSATVTLRIPAADLPRVLDEIAALGELQHSSTSSQDVTMQVTDLSARIGALEAAIDRLTELLGEADSAADLIQIETAMTDRQAELDSLRAQQRHLEAQVSMSTLTVDFQTEPTAPKTGPDDFVAGILAGWDALVAFGAGLLVALGVLLPWLVPLGIVVLIVWLVVRAVRRRRPAAAERDPGTVDAPPTTTASGWPVVPGDREG